MTNPTVWKVAAGMLAGEGSPHQPVAGWQYGCLFLDYRPLIRPERHDIPFAWMISHLPTGLALVGLLTDLPQSKALVEDLYRRIDWLAVAPGGVSPQPFNEWRLALFCDYCTSSQAISPLSTVEHIAGRDQ